MNKRVIIVGVVVLGLIALTIFKLKTNKEKANEKIYIHDANAAILVETENPQNHTFESSYSFLGTFEPVRQNVVSSDANGKIVRMNVDMGSTVSKGQVIAKVDDEMIQLQIQSVDVNIEGAKNDDQRYENLSKENAVAGVTVEKTKLGLKSAEIQKKQLQKQLRSTNLIAPFSGTVTKKMIDLGSVVGPGSQLIELTDISSLKLTVNVPERDILKFKMGKEVEVTADIYQGRKFKGKVTNINIVADQAHNFKVQITVSNASRELMAGMYGSVQLGNSQSKTALSIPRKALIGSSKSPKVYVVRNGKAKLISFNAGTSDGEFVEVISGINAGDKIVTKGQVNLEDNSNVKISK